MKDFSWPVSAFNEKEFRKFSLDIDANYEKMYGREVYIFGAGIRGCIFLKFCEMKNIKVTGFIDNDPNKADGCIGDYRIQKFEEVHEQKIPYYVIVSTENSQGIIQQLTKEGLEQGEDFLSVKTDLYDNFADNFFRKDDYPYLFLGDCIFSQVAVGDSSYDSLEDMVYHEFGKERCNILGMHGMPIRTFYHLVRLLLKSGRIPQKVVLVVNTVMFAGKKNQLPRAQHTPLLRKIQEKLDFDDKEFWDYVKITEERMERFQTDAFVSTSSNIKNRNSRRIEDLRMKINYMYSLDENEEGVVYLRKLAELCREYKVEFVPFLPPINYEYGGNVFGEEFHSFCRANAQRLKDMLGKGYGVTLWDAGYLLSQDYFAASDTINEITNYAGRQKELAFIKNILGE